MKQRSLSYLLAIALAIVGTATFMSLSRTTVFVTNKLPFSFMPTFVQTGPKTLDDQYWHLDKTPIAGNTIHHKVADFSRDKGVSDNHLWEYLSTSGFEQALKFGQHIWKKGLKSDMEFTIDAPGATGKWTSDDWYYWDNYVATSIKNNMGQLMPVEIRCRKIPKTLPTNDDLEYVISEPLNKYIEYPPLPQMGPNSLAILSYNTYLMTIKSMELFKFIPLFVPKLKELEKPGVSIRSKLLPEAIGPDFDVLALSEVWDSDARFNLLTGLKKQGYKYATCILGSGFMSEWGKHAPIEIGKRIEDAIRMIKERTGKVLTQPWIIDFNDPRFGVDKTYTIGGIGTFPSGVDIALTAEKLGNIGNGGVIIVSKWPIKEVREWIFEKGSFTEYVKKGALYAKIDKEGKIYNIIATHTAGAMSVASVAAFADALKLPTNEPLLFAGDWNTNLIENTKDFALLKSTIPEWIGSKITADCVTNALRLWETNNLTIDFIIYSNLHLKPSQSSVTVRKITSKTPWSDDKYPFAKEQPTRNVYDLSDHFGLVGLFTFA